MMTRRTCVTAAIAATCAAGATAAADVETGPALQASTMHVADAPVFLLDAGDLNGDGGRPDIVAIDGEGTVMRLGIVNATWAADELPVSMEPVPSSGMASRPTLEIGNVLTQHPGREMVVQTEYNVSVLKQTAADSWQKEIVADFSDMTGLHWGARIGQINPQQPGEEIFYIFEGVFDFSTGHYLRPAGDKWLDDIVYMEEVGMDSAIGAIDPDAAINEIVITTEMGPTYAITPDIGDGVIDTWDKRLLWDDYEHSGWRVLIDDVLPDRKGNEIVYGTRYSNSILISYETDQGHEMEVLFTGTSEFPAPSMYDVAVGNINPDSPALEIVGVDATGSVYLVEYDGEDWSGRTVWEDPDGGLHAVTVADVLPACPGDEIIVAGESGAITLLAPTAAGPADLNCDGTVNGADLGILLSAWGPCNDPEDCPEDLSNDGTVGGADLGILLSNWTG